MAEHRGRVIAEMIGCVCPIAESAEVEHEYWISLTNWTQLPSDADAIVAAVSHKEYKAMALAEPTSNLRKDGIFTDVKSAYDQAAIKAAGFSLWRL